MVESRGVGSMGFGTGNTDLSVDPNDGSTGFGRSTGVPGVSRPPGAGGITGVLKRTQAQTAEGGSKFDPPAVVSPAQIPSAVMTVLFRPYPWEAHNLNGLIAASEGVLLVVLLVTGRRRLLYWAKMLGRRPYLVFALAYAFIFVLAFSYIGNFGILARQRTQMIPLALTMLGMPALVRNRPSWFGARWQRSRGVRSTAADDDRTGPPQPDSPDEMLPSPQAAPAGARLPSLPSSHRRAVLPRGEHRQ